MNPSTADLLAAVEALPEQGVVLLPNSKNVVLAAEQAAEQSGKDVRVIPTRSLQAGLGALVAFDVGRPLDENVAEMEEAAAAVRAGLGRPRLPLRQGRTTWTWPKESSSGSWTASRSPRARSSNPWRRT